MGQNCCISLKEEISPTNISIPLNNLNILGRNNSILNRWRHIEIITLQYIFLNNCSVSNNGLRNLDEESFFKIFSKLKEMNLDNLTKDAIYRVFDITGRGVIDFRDFCRGLSICSHGTRGELLHFLFDIGVGSHTIVTTSKLLGESGENNIVRQNNNNNNKREQGRQNSGNKLQVEPVVFSNGDSAFSNLEECENQKLPNNSPTPFQIETSKSKKNFTTEEQSRELNQQNSFRYPQNLGNGDEEFETNDPDITHTALVRVLKLCGLTAPPAKFTYRSSSGVPIEYSGNKLTLTEYLDFADVYIDDGALQKFMSLFTILPGKLEERNDVMNVLKIGASNMLFGNTLYLISERWWQQWCHFAQVTPIYDTTNYCVIGLKLAQSGVPSSVDEIPDRPDGIDNSLILDPIDSYSLREEIKFIYNTQFQLLSGINPILIENHDLQYSHTLTRPETNSIDSLNTDTSFINGLEELVMKDEKNKKGVLHRIESEKSILNGSEVTSGTILEERLSLNKIESHSRTFSILTREVWECLRGYYGGGPAIPRLISHVTTKSIIDRNEIRTTKDLNHITITSDIKGEKGYWIDINPLSLHLFISDCAGNPIPIPRAAIVGRNESIESFISRTITTYIQSTKLIEKYPNDSSNEILTQKFFEQNYSDIELNNNNNNNSNNNNNDSSKSFLSSIIRFWVLIYHNALDINLEEDGSNNPLSSRNRTLQPEETGDLNGNTSTEENKLMIRHGPLSWWVLVDTVSASSNTTKNESDDKYSIPNLENLLGMSNGTKVMLEFKNSDGKWPTEKLLEDPDFRLFEIGDKIDARDHAGIWYPAEIVDIEWGIKETIGWVMSNRVRSIFQNQDTRILTQKQISYHKFHKGFIQNVKVHFENYSNKWDEIFPPESSNIAPLASHTQPIDSLSQFPNDINSFIQWICEYGTEGKCSSSKEIDKLDSLSLEYPHSPSPASPNNPELEKAHLIAVQKKTSTNLIFEWFKFKKVEQKQTLPSNNQNISNESRISPIPHKRSSKGTIAVLPTNNGPSDNISSSDQLTPRHNNITSAGERLTTPARNIARTLFASIGMSPEHNNHNHNNSSNNRNNINQYGQLNRSRIPTHQDVEMKSENNINEVRIVRRAPKSSHVGAIPGACGLLNIGNTCFMSVGLQCLSHTPLLRSYFLSGRYLDEINRENPLGTGGKLVSEFAQLLRLIWSGSNVHISPLKFKKVLEKCKPIFVGHDQQDAQEFLSEILDSLHEDVNRVIVKPYVKAPDDQIWDKMTISQQADDAWQRHLQRNRSVLVDLFQGQLMSEVTCQTCKKTSRTFDPFMLLSVPLPKHSEKQISIYLIRKMPHFPRQPYNAYGEGSYNSKEFIDNIRERSPIIRYCLNVPKLGDISDLKVVLSKQCGIKPETLMIVEVIDGRMIKIFEDRDGIATLRDFNYTWSILSNINNSCYPPGGLYILLALESVKDLSFISTLQGNSLNERSGLATKTQSRKSDNNILNSEKLLPIDSNKSYFEKVHLDPIEPIEYKFGGDSREGDIVSDLELPKNTGKSFPKSFFKTIIGTRLDAIDHKGQWYPGQVLAVQNLNNEGQEEDNEPKIRVHFDNFAPKWDEVYTESDFIDGRLVPLYTNSQRKLRVIDLVVINRLVPNHGRNQMEQAAGDNIEIFGLPFMFQVECFRSCEHVYRHLVEQSLRYLTNEELDILIEKGLFEIDNEEKDSINSWIKTDLLPFQIRIVSFQESLAPPLDENKMTIVNTPWEGILFPRDKDRPIINIYWNRLQIAIDWISPPSNFIRGGIIVDHESHIAACETMKLKGTVTDDGSVSLLDCFSSFTAEEELDDGTWYCNRCKTHQKGKVIQKLYRLPDILVVHIKRFNMTARFREKIRAKVAYPIKSLDMSPYCVPRYKDVKKKKSNITILEETNYQSNHNEIYDLYGVSNHIGGMNGGHYTAFVRLDSGTDIDFDDIHLPHQDFKEKKQNISQSENLLKYISPHGLNTTQDKWLLFDDDFVEEIPLDRVVSDQAYVLFYKRRKLTPSNIINMTI